MAGWRVFVPVIGINAGIQALLVTSDPVPLASWVFGLLAAASAAGILLSIWLISAAALAAVDGHPRPSRLLHRPVVLAWAAGLGILAAAVAVLAWWATPLVMISGALVLPPAADGQRHPLAAAFGTVRRHPGRAAILAVGVLLLAAATWVVELVLGFFVTGVAAAAATWLWLGAVLVLVLCWSCSLYRGPSRSGGPASGLSAGTPT